MADCKGFATIGEYDNGQPGEIFLTVSKQGSTMAGVMDAFAKSVSYGLQYGVPLRAFVEAFTNMRFEPAGMTDDPDIRFASSIMDYLFRRLAIEYMTYDERAELGIFSVDERLQPTLPGLDEQVTPTHQGSDLAPDPKSVAEAVVAELPFAVAETGPLERRPDVHAVRRRDGPRRQLLRLHLLRQHQRLLLIAPRAHKSGEGTRQDYRPCMADDARELIRYHAEGKVGVITIDRPEKRNAMTYAMLGEFIETVGRADEDPATTVSGGHGRARGLLRGDRSRRSRNGAG